MNIKKAASIIAAGALLASTLPVAVGCSDSDSLGKATFNIGTEYYRSVGSRHSLNYDEMMYDDFTDGIDLSRWVISDSVWEQWETDQNGVRPQNVFLVDDKDNPDTHLLLRANGAYYDMAKDPLYTEEEKKQYGDGNTLFTASQGYGQNSGACITTIDALGPGRYEVKMKACPRVGALTSMWVYSWFTQDDGSTQQNEIDIEIGLKPDFSQVFYTTWTSPSNNTNMPTPVDYFVNDGDWHVYTFDWVTDTAIPYVEYFIDGVKILKLDANVPRTNATLNLGIWCPSWAGGGLVDPDNSGKAITSRMFESDYAEISWWRFIPFQMSGWEQRTVQNRNYADGYVPKTLTSLPNANKCANADFETADYPGYDLPWKDYTITDEDNLLYVEGSSVTITEETVGETVNHCAEIVNGGSLGQWLRGASTGFKYRLSGKYRTTGEATPALCLFYILDYSVESPMSTDATFTLGGASETWKEFTYEFTIDEEDTRSIIYNLVNGTAKGTVFFDDLSLVYLGHEAYAK